MVTLVPDSNGEDNAPVFLLRLREFNQCHNPEGEGGGQFCSTDPHAVRVVPAADSGLSAESIASYTKYYGPEGGKWWAVIQGDQPGVQIRSKSFGGHPMLMGGPHEKESWAIRGYLDNGYLKLNRGLRYGNSSGSPELDRIIARNVLLEPVTVYRAAHTDGLTGLKVGDRVLDKGYLSTTWDRQVAEQIVHAGLWTGSGSKKEKDPRPRHTIAIDLPKGQHALEVEQWESKDYGEISEREYLLPRGMTLEVTEVDTQGRVVRMKAVPR